MRPALRPGSPLLRRDAEHLQVGTEPGHALVFHAGARLSKLLTSLDGVRSPSDAGLDSGLVESLLTAGLVVDADAWRAEAGLENEAAHLLARGVEAGSAHRQLTTRRQASVCIVGDDTLAETITPLLDASGVGSITHGPTPAADHDVVILAAEGEAARDVGDECLRANLPHLVAAVRDGCGVVGPLVVPGRSACLRCVDAERSAADAAWPAIVAQLDRPLSTSSTSPVRAVSAVLEAAVAVLTVRDILAHIAGEPTLTNGATIQLGPDLSSLRRHRWPLHPDCGCALLV